MKKMAALALALTVTGTPGAMAAEKDSFLKQLISGNFSGGASDRDSDSGDRYHNGGSRSEDRDHNTRDDDSRDDDHGNDRDSVSRGSDDDHGRDDRGSDDRGSNDRGSHDDDGGRDHDDGPDDD